jgi:Nuclease-related domain
MSQLIEQRWKRFGNDRVYVRDSDGNEIGHVDLKKRTVAAAEACYEATLEDCLRRWASADARTSAAPIGLPPPSPPEAPPPASPPVLAAPTPPPPVIEEAVADPSVDVGPAATSTADPTVDAELTAVSEPRDLASNEAGAAARAERDRINSEAPVRNLLARLCGVKTDERAWRIGAKGEEKVGRQLAKLGAGWHVLHAVPVGKNGSDIDHVVIGPPGVVTINTKCHPRGDVWVARRALLVNGHKTDYLRNSQFEATRAAELLSAACGRPIEVRAAIVFVDLEDIKIKQMPPDVHVATRRRVVEWLHSLPVTTTPDDVDEIFSRARNSNTWKTP